MSELNPTVGKIMNRLKKSKTQKQQYLATWKELDEFYRGDQYKDASIPPWVPKPVTNFIHLIVTTKRAALASENPMAMLRPLSPLDTEQVSKLQVVYEWVWKKIKARKVLRDNIETSKLLGTAIAYVYWDEMTGVLGGTETQYEGEIKIKEIDPMNFHVDPNAYRLQDAAWVHVTEKRNRKWVEQEFGVSLKEERADQDNYGEEYNRTYYSNNDKEDEMIDFHAHYEKYWNTERVPVESEISIDDEEETEEIGGWNVKVTYVAGNKLLRTVDPLEPNIYPFAVLYDYAQRQEFWGKGTGSLILDNQKLINKVESIIAMIGTLLQNPQKIIRKGSGISPIEAMKYSFAPGHVWVANGDIHNAVRWQEVPQIPQALINLAEMAKGNIREITGMNEAYMGGTVGSLQTSGGVNTLVDRATMRDRDQMFDIEEYVDQLSRIILAFVTTKYTEERYVRLVEDPSNPEATTKFIEFIGRDFAGIEYDLDIDVSAHAPITQQRKESELRELMQIQGQYGFAPALITPQEFVKGVRMVDADKIVKRMNDEKLANNLAKLTQVMNMMQEAVQAQVPPDEIMQMAQAQLQGLESGQIPLPGQEPSGIGNAANNMGQTQMQQMSL